MNGLCGEKKTSTHHQPSYSWGAGDDEDDDLTASSRRATNTTKRRIQNRFQISYHTEAE
jgi:hypothetical protein